MEHCGNVGLDYFAKPLPIAAFEQMRFAGFGALLQGERRGCVRPIRQGLIDLLVYVSKRRVAFSIRVEQFALLFGCALFFWNCQQLALDCRERICLQRRGLRSGADAEASEGMAIETGVLVGRAVMTVAIAVLLINGELQSR